MCIERSQHPEDCEKGRSSRCQTVPEILNFDVAGCGTMTGDREKFQASKIAMGAHCSFVYIHCEEKTGLQASVFFPRNAVEERRVRRHSSFAHLAFLSTSRHVLSSCNIENQHLGNGLTSGSVLFTWFRMLRSLDTDDFQIDSKHFNGAYANSCDPGDTYTIRKVLPRCMTRVDGRPQCHSLAEIWEGEVSDTAEDKGNGEIRTWRGAQFEFSSSREFAYSIYTQSGLRRNTVHELQ
jgi:hypothetical protein